MKKKVSKSKAGLHQSLSTFSAIKVYVRDISSSNKYYKKIFDSFLLGTLCKQEEYKMVLYQGKSCRDEVYSVSTTVALMSQRFSQCGTWH